MIILKKPYPDDNIVCCDIWAGQYGETQALSLPSVKPVTLRSLA